MSYNQIQTTKQTRPRKDAQPEDDVPYQPTATHKARPTQRDKRQLRHLEKEQIASQSPENTQHDQFMNTRR